MRGPIALVRSYTTARGVALAAAVAVCLGMIVRYVVIPPYRDVIGFIPFDAHPRLSHVMVGIELGAFRRGAAPEIYLLFAVADAAYAAATAWAFTLGWAWLFAKIPNRIFSFLSRGGMLMIPLYEMILNLVGKGCFYRLVRGINGESYSDAIEFSVIVHRLSSALADVRIYLTLAFLLAAAVGLILRRVRP